MDGVAALVVVQSGQVVEAGGDIRVVRAEGLLIDLTRALVERFGVGVAALVFLQPGQLVEAYCILLMCFVKFLFC